MAKRLNDNISVGDVLKEIIGTNKLQPGIDQVAVKEAWLNLMGNGVNSYTRNIMFKGNTLYVELRSAVLREELSCGKQKIITMLNDELKREVVKDLILR